jgi:CheY-like chemotaxis protein
VLFVEDEANTRTAVRWLLEKCGATVTAVVSAASAVAAFRENDRPDVLVADIGLPGTDGHDLLRSVRQIERERGEGAAVPAMALTAYARPEDRVQAIAAGYQVHVAKPVEPEMLVAAVAALVGRAAT